MLHGHLRALPFLTFVLSSYAAIYNNPDSLPNVKYDFVIVGGGTAGDVLANRLSENKKWQVLVIEDGPTNEGVLNSEVPFFVGKLGRSAYDWNFTTTSQNGLNGRSLNYLRGHMLGGTSSINGMFYTRGSSDDFDRWARVTGDNGWSWKKLMPYFIKNEKWVPPADNHDTTGQFDPSIHGSKGEVSVSLSGFPQQAFDDKIVQTTVELRHEFPFVLDMNNGRPLGVGFLQATIGGGKRSSAATGYLTPQVIARPNLHILVETRVIAVRPGEGKNKKAFRTVEFAKGASGVRKFVTAKKEVILSAGTFGTPHLLMHSGIGDKNELSKVGITSLVNNPSVGKNLSDQALVANAWFVNSNSTLDPFNQDPVRQAEALVEWIATKTGPLVMPPVGYVAWQRLPSNSSIFQQFPDPAAGPNTPHYELAIANSGGFVRIPGSYVSLGTAVVTPHARGSIALNTSNPFDQPLINPGLLDHPFDLFAMREAIKSARRFLEAPTWAGYVLEPSAALKNATTDELLDQYIKNSAFSTSHPVGTAAMSKKNAPYGVVDPDLLVKGVTGLRIVDASVMPFVICGHTQAPVYVIAERAADMIKAAWD